MTDEPRVPLPPGGARRRIQRDVEDEIQGHIELKARDLRREGVPPGEAWERAVAAFGQAAAVGSECAAIQRGLSRRRRLRTGLDDLVGDVAWALRSLRRSPGFTTFAVLTLALSIAANTAIFSVVRGLFDRSLPGVVDPETLVDIWREPGFVSVSYPMFQHFRRNASLLEDVAAFDLVGLAVGGDQAPEVVMGLQVSGNYLDLLGTRPALGRFFTPEEATWPPSRSAVVLSWALWTRHFDADPDVLGSTVLLNGQPVTVVGVTEEGFGGPLAAISAAAFVPLGTPIPGVHSADLGDIDSGSLELIGRVGPGTDDDVLAAQLSQLGTARLRAEDPEAREYAVGVREHSSVPVTMRGPVRGFFAALSALVGLLLLIGCVNVANLLLSRSATRRQELAIRRSLGAGRRRLVRQLLTESLVLAAVACALGTALTWWLTTALGRFQLPVAPLPGLRLALRLTPDAGVLTYSVILATATGVAFGLVPALRATRTDLVTDLRDGARGSSGRGRLQGVLVGAQVAASLVLLTASGLFLRALLSVEKLDPGFDTTDVWVASFDLELAGRSNEESWPFYAELRRRAAALPGVRSASVAGKIPIAGLSQMAPVNFEGVEPPEGSRGFTLANQSVGPDYFRTLGERLLAGRGIAELDGPDAPRVVVVNERLATRFWPGESALGKRVTTVDPRSGEPLAWEVVGVVATARYNSLAEEPRAFAFFPASQRPRTDMILHLEMAPGVPPPMRDVRALASTLEPAAAVLSSGSLDAAVGLRMLPQRLGAWVTGVVGAFGLLLGALGVYAITAYQVARRSREIGIRVALGADTASVVGRVLARGMRAPAVGAAVGLAVALATTRFLQAFIFGVDPLDPLTLGAAVSVLGLAALTANLVPALRAARVDPAKALRTE